MKDLSGGCLSIDLVTSIQNDNWTNTLVEVVNSYEDGELSVGKCGLSEWKWLWSVFGGGNVISIIYLLLFSITYRKVGHLHILFISL